jgi:hypothetical protein
MAPPTAANHTLSVLPSATVSTPLPLLSFYTKQKSRLIILREIAYPLHGRKVISSNRICRVKPDQIATDVEAVRNGLVTVHRFSGRHNTNCTAAGVFTPRAAKRRRRICSEKRDISIY